MIGAVFVVCFVITEMECKCTLYAKAHEIGPKKESD